MNIANTSRYSSLGKSRNQLAAKERHEGLTAQEQVELDDIDKSMEELEQGFLDELGLVSADLGETENPMETVGTAL